MNTTSNPYRGHRFPKAVISYCVWLYFRFALSFRDVEEIMAERGAIHVHDKRANNRAENSHQPTRIRERRMRRFKSASHAQRFLSIFSVVHDHFSISRHTLSADNARNAKNKRLQEWRHIAGVVSAK